jgi:hypothetical protein
VGVRADCAGCANPATRQVDGIDWCDACGPDAPHWSQRDTDVKRIAADHYLTNHPHLRGTHADLPALLD